MVEPNSTQSSSTGAEIPPVEEHSSQSVLNTLGLDSLGRQLKDVSELVGATWGAASAIGQLAAAEFVLALSMIPKVAAGAILLIPIAMFFWLGLSTTLGYLGYVYWDNLLAAFAIFTLLQLVTMIGLFMSLRSWKRKMYFHGTRTQIRAISEAIHNETRAHHLAAGEQRPEELRPAPGHPGST